MKYSMFFLRRRTLILKAVLVLTALWFMVALFTTSGSSRNALGAPPLEYDEPEAKPLKSVKSTSTKKKSESYGNNLSDGLYKFDFTMRLVEVHDIVNNNLVIMVPFVWQTMRKVECL